MGKKKFKWYSPIRFLVGAILSFADPITDILTLVEFYRTDHKTWFCVGLTFVILPCLVFPILYHGRRPREALGYSGIRQCTQAVLCGFHPFSAAFARLQGFVSCLKKWWRGEEIDATDNWKTDYLLWHIDLAVVFESVLESAPQFILQLYVVSVQEKPVEVIQIISLPVSFLSIAWAFTIFDEMSRSFFQTINALKVKHKLALFVTHLFLLSSRLFAVCFFTVSYKWWVIVILLFHTFMIVAADMYNTPFWPYGKCELRASFISVLLFCFHWLKDDLSLHLVSSSELVEDSVDKFKLAKMQVLSSILFVVENVLMILLFNCSQHSNTWYGLKVTQCVCVFSVVGFFMRVFIYYCVILKE